MLFTACGCTSPSLASPRSSALARLAGCLRRALARRSSRAFRHVVRSGAPYALAKRITERGRATMLLQKIGEGLVGECLEIPAAVARQRVERDPDFIIELNTLALHSLCPSRLAAGCYGRRC